MASSPSSKRCKKDGACAIETVTATSTPQNTVLDVRRVIAAVIMGRTYIAVRSKRGHRPRVLGDVARERRDIAAGIALALVLLKPNTAILVPIALLVAGRYRAVAAWAGAGAVVAGVALATMGSSGVSAYIGQLTGPLPAGANSLTFEARSE